MPLTYVAQRRLKLGADHWALPGDLVPDAARWRHVDVYLKNGFLALINVSDEELVGSVDVEPVDDPVQTETEEGDTDSTVRVSLESLSYNELRSHAVALGVSAGGSAAALIERILASGDEED